MENKSNLVVLRKDDVFTTSKVISEGTGVSHRKLKVTIIKYKQVIETFGLLAPYRAESSGGRPEEFFLLTEQQATFLITLLKNTEKVVAFKAELVKQFFEMRKILYERNTAAWIDTRKQSKLNRKAESDVIKQLVAYAEQQGSKHSDKLYITYSTLANKTVGISDRNLATTVQLNNLALVENIILNTVQSCMADGIHYKDIYQFCKVKLEQFSRLVFITN